jgi:hypothetical protein
VAIREQIKSHHGYKFIGPIGKYSRTQYIEYTRTLFSHHISFLLISGTYCFLVKTLVHLQRKCSFESSMPKGCITLRGISRERGKKTNELWYYNRKRANVLKNPNHENFRTRLKALFFITFELGENSDTSSAADVQYVTRAMSRDSRGKRLKLAFNLVRLRERLSNNFTTRKWLKSWNQDPFHQNAANQLHITDQKCWGSMTIPSLQLMGVKMVLSRENGKRVSGNIFKTSDNWQWVLHWQ